MAVATSANTVVNRRGAPNVMAKTCWAELMKPNRPPSIMVMASM